MTNLSKVPGYLISLLFKGRSVCYENLSFINSEPYGSFTIELRRSAAELPFSVSSPYRVSAAKNICPLQNDEGVYRHTVSIKIGYDEDRNPFVTKGTVRFLAFTTDGKICEYELGVFSQNGKHYFCMQRNWQSRLCQDLQGKPTLENITWPQMVDYAQNVLGLIPCGTVSAQEMNASPVEKLSDGQGKVVWFKIPSGVGLIATNRGDAKVHYSDIITGRDREVSYLLPGQIVRAKIVPTARNLKTDLPFIAKEVRPLE